MPLELQFENVDKLFQAFETSMEKNAYTEVGKIVKAISDIIDNLKAVIEEARPIVNLGKNLIPKKIDDIKNIASKMNKEGYNLEYLNIDYNIGKGVMVRKYKITKKSKEELLFNSSLTSFIIIRTRIAHFFIFFAFYFIIHLHT